MRNLNSQYHPQPVFFTESLRSSSVKPLFAVNTDFSKNDRFSEPHCSSWVIVRTLFGPANESLGPGLVSEVFKLQRADGENTENLDFFKISCEKRPVSSKKCIFLVTCRPDGRRILIVTCPPEPMVHNRSKSF